jgi:hypothetical protein
MKTYLAAIIIAVSAVVCAQQPPTLATYQQSYAKQEQAIVAKYGTTLTTRMAELKKKGDLDGYLLLQAEEKRFQEEKRVPVPKEANQTVRPLTEAHFQELATLLDKYIKALDGLMKSETAADRIESAKSVKAEKEKATTLLEDVKSKLPAKEEAKDPIPKKAANPITDMMDLQNVSPEDKQALGTQMPGGDKTLFNGQLTLRVFARGVLVVKSGATQPSENGNLKLSMERVILQKKSPNNEPMGDIAGTYAAQGGKKKFGAPLEGEIILFGDEYRMHVFRRSLVVWRRHDRNVQSLFFIKDFDSR